MDSFPLVAGTFKLLVLGIGMFFAIKWHYDQGKRNQTQGPKASVLRMGGMVSAIFALSLLGLGLAALVLVRMLGLDLNFP